MTDPDGKLNLVAVVVAELFSPMEGFIHPSLGFSYL